MKFGSLIQKKKPNSNTTFLMGYGTNETEQISNYTLLLWR